MDIYASDPILIAAQQHRQQYQYSQSSGGSGGLTIQTGLTTTAHGQPDQHQEQNLHHHQQEQQQYQPSADIMELCRIFLLNFYLKHFGRMRLFDLLQREHDRYNLATTRSYALLLACFTITWLLQTDLYQFLGNILRQQLGV